MLKKYGVEYAIQSKEIKDKIKKTNIEKYGEMYPLKTEIIKKRLVQNNIKKYNVENPMQNSIIAQKCCESYKSKSFIFPSGNEIMCQGYEYIALQELIESNFKEDDIITGCKNVPTIWYNDENGKKHRHYVDIFIPSQNKCIEVKSTWTLKLQKSNIFLKQNAAKEIGYEYEIWVYDNKGNKVETFT
jgi:hypothetical protein